MPVTHRTARAASTWLKNVIYADRGIIVLNKPPGLVCQGSVAEASASDVLAADFGQKNSPNFNGLLGELKNKFDLNTNPYPIHRLDKATTGALVLAKNLNLARELSQQFQSRTVEKTYLALVRGGEESFPGQTGEIRALLKFVDGRASIGSATDGKLAETDWELISSSKLAPVSLVRLKLHTGLKHQLRAHLAYALHTPILGDTVHSQSKVSRKITDATTQLPEGRMFLHSSHISFFRYKQSGPNKRFRLGITAPLPNDFLRLCSDLDISVGSTGMKGGMFIDGTPVVAEEIPEVHGRWLNRGS